MEAYRIVKTGTLYALTIGAGTNSATCGKLAIQTSATLSSTLTLATNLSSVANSTSGN